jgi:GST-like protein
VDLKTRSEAMIDLYTWPTPNGHKIHIMLEETGLPYRVHAIDIGAGDQFKPEFLKISPNNKMPAMIDSEGPDGKPISMFESGAMLLYLASKTGQFLPEDLRDRWSTLQWLMFQMGGVGPMLGQAHHFLIYAPEKIAYAMQRYSKEANRLYGVIDRRLAESEFIACSEYSIADMAIMPWLRSYKNQGVEMDDYKNVKRWFDGIAARPAVQRGLAVLADRRKPLMDDKAKEMLFGAAQYQKR